MKTLKVEIPNGFEIDKEKSTFEEIVFKSIRKELPESWEELKELEGFYIGADSDIYYIKETFCLKRNRNLFATEDQAQAAIALAQLSQLREVYRDGWKPYWSDSDQDKYVIYFNYEDIEVRCSPYTHHFLSFQDEETRDLFLENFRDLIEQAKPLLA